MGPRLGLLLIMLFSCRAVPAADRFMSDIAPLIDEHCSDCHWGTKAKGDLALDRFTSTDDVEKEPERWEHILSEVRAYHMPPPKDSSLSLADREKITTWISTTLDGVYSRLPPDPGSPALRRLTRPEYDRTVSDLLGVDLHLSDRFPADGGGGEGFQNNADTLFVPPLLLEKLLSAADEAITAAKTERLCIVTTDSERARDRKDAAKATAAAFGLRAFRRPLNGMEQDRWIRVWEACLKKGLSEDIAIRQMLRAMIASPQFLFRVELQQRSIKPYLVTSYDMASRLSYFLWGTMPDDELFTLAEQDRLQDDDVIRGQVERMLASPKAKAFSETFAIQWLRLDPLREGAGPDMGKFPEYTYELRESMLGEVGAFMHGMISYDRPIVDLLDSDYTWVDGRLARLYGINGGGDGFTKVKLPNSQRGGVTGMAAVHAITSYPGRTSLVLRGAWVLDRLLDTPPPPPPPNVAQISKDDSPKEALTLRARLEQHRADPKCSGCHDRIDPVGYPLEHFDAIGRWVDRDIRGEPIDAKGTLPDGTEIDGPEALRKALIARRDQFADTFTRKLLGYALGRGIRPTDRPTLTALHTTLTKNEYRIKPLITEICLSFPFRYRSNLR
jgi:hypothetical protein